MPLFKHTKELLLELDPPSESPDVYEGLPGYDPQLGPSAILTGKVMFPISRPCKDVEALILKFIGKVQIDTYKLLDAVMGSQESTDDIKKSTSSLHNESKKQFTKVLVKEQLVIFKWPHPSTLPPQKYEWRFAMHMGRHAHLPSTVETTLGRVIYSVEAVLERKKKRGSDISRDLSVSKQVTLTRCRPLSLMQQGIRIAKGLSQDNGLFGYEVQLPKEVYADGKDIRVIAKIKTLDNTKVHTVKDVECSLKEERIYGIVDPAVESNENIPKRICQEGFLGKSIRYRETVKNSLLFDNFKSTGNDSDRERRTALASAMLSAANDEYMIMTFHLPVLGAIPDMNLDEMTVRHALYFKIEYTNGSAKEGTEYFEISIPMFLGASNARDDESSPFYYTSPAGAHTQRHHSTGTSVSNPQSGNYTSGNSTNNNINLNVSSNSMGATTSGNSNL